MRAARRLRLPLAIAAGLFVFACLLSSASAEGSSADGGYAAAVMASQPVGWWRLGETTGGYADSSGRTAAHPAQLQAPRSTFIRGETDCPPFPDSDGCINMTAAPKWALDPLDQSWVYVPAGYGDPTFDFGGQRPFTYEAWINPNQGQNSVHEGILGTFGMDTSGSFDTGTGLYFDSPDNTLTFNRTGYAAGASWVDHTAISTVVTPGEWAHVVATYDGTAMRLYVNGEERASAASSVNAAEPNSAVSIGAMDFDWGVTDYFGFFYGSIDEPAVYDRALSTDEVRVHYEAATPATLTVTPDSGEVSVADTVTVNLKSNDPSLANGQSILVTVQGADDLQQNVVLGSDGTASFSYYAGAEGTDTIQASFGALRSNAASVAVRIPPLPAVTFSYYETQPKNLTVIKKQGFLLGKSGIKAMVFIAVGSPAKDGNGVKAWSYGRVAYNDDAPKDTSVARELHAFAVGYHNGHVGHHGSVTIVVGVDNVYDRAWNDDLSSASESGKTFARLVSNFNTWLHSSTARADGSVYGRQFAIAGFDLEDEYPYSKYGVTAAFVDGFNRFRPQVPSVNYGALDFHPTSPTKVRGWTGPRVLNMSRPTWDSNMNAVHGTWVTCPEVYNTNFIDYWLELEAMTAPGAEYADGGRVYMICLFNSERVPLNYRTSWREWWKRVHRAKLPSWWVGHLVTQIEANGRVTPKEPVVP